MEEGVKDLSNKKLREKAFNLVIFIIICGDIHLLKNIQCGVKVKIDINNTVSNNNLVIDNSILAVFIRKQNEEKAVVVFPYNSIAIGLGKIGWAIFRVKRSFMLFINPLVWFFRQI